MKTEEMGTSDMPVPQTIQYEEMYKITDLFKNDLKIILKDVPYVEAKKYLDIIELYETNNNGVIPIAALTEFIRNLATIPYRIVNPLMKVIENKENFAKYFTLIIPDKK